MKAVRGRLLTIDLNDRLHLGDRLKIMPANDQTGTGLTVLRLLVKGRECKVASGGEVGIESPAAEKIRPGEEVYKVAAEQAYNLDEAGCRKRLAAAPKAVTPMSLSLQVSSERIGLRAEAAGVSLEASYPVTSSPATTHPLDREILHKTFAKTGELPLTLKNLRTGKLPPLVIPPSRVNEIRRDFYQRLSESLAQAAAAQHQQRREMARASLLTAAASSPAPRQLTVSVPAAADLKVLQEADIARAVLPLTPENVRESAREKLPLPGDYGRVVWDIPTLIFPADWDDFRGVIGQLRTRGLPPSGSTTRAISPSSPIARIWSCWAVPPSTP